MEIRIPNFNEIEKTHKKKRNQFINLILVLLCGIYCVNEDNMMLINMGWFMIIVGFLFIFLCYIVPTVYFLTNYIIHNIVHKFSKRKTIFYTPKLDKTYINKKFDKNEQK